MEAMATRSFISEAIENLAPCLPRFHQADGLYSPIAAISPTFVCCRSFMTSTNGWTPIDLQGREISYPSFALFRLQFDNIPGGLLGCPPEKIGKIIRVAKPHSMGDLLYR